MLAHDLLAVLPFVWRDARDDLEEHRAERVEVGAAIEIRVPDGLFGAHVGGRADHEPGLRVARTAVEALGDAEVHQQRSPRTGVEHDVVGLDVAVDEPGFVRVLQRGKDSERQRHGARDGHRPLALEHRGERFAVHEGHRVVHEALSLADKMDGQDVGMVERGNRASLLAEPRQRALGPDEVGPQHLDREPPAELQVQHLVDLREPAGADTSAHVVLRAQGRGEPLRHRAGPRYGDRLRHGGLVVRHRLSQRVRFRACRAREALSAPGGSC